MSLLKINTELSNFLTITLEEMDKVKLMDRVETKFVLSANQLPFILSIIKNAYKAVVFNDNLIPEYKTVYFDTDDLFFYNEHHRKRKDRYKVRYRNYIDSSLTFLEVKHKKNGRVDKQRIKVPNERFTLNQEEQAFLEEVNIDKNNLKLKLTNNYNRLTLVANQSVERVTFDMNIRFKSKGEEKTLENVVIIELKQPVLSRETPIYKALKEAGVKPYNVSKYCIGIIKTHGTDNVKYNRFKKKLLKLDKIMAYDN